MQLTATLPRTPTPLLLRRLLAIEFGGVIRKCARLFGINRPAVLSLADLKVPDSALCRQATEFAASLESPMLFNHSMRTFLFGTAVGKHLRIAVDPELLYLSSILHDIGLTPEFEAADSFELNGARGAHRFLLDAGMPAERAACVHEAIALHSAVGIANHGAPELKLVHFGAGVDVLGYHAEDIAQPTLNAIVAQYPRHRFKVDFTALLSAQAARKPQCHIAGHMSLGFARKMAGAPFAE